MLYRHVKRTVEFNNLPRHCITNEEFRNLFKTITYNCSCRQDIYVTYDLEEIESNAKMNYINPEFINYQENDNACDHINLCQKISHTVSRMKYIQNSHHYNNFVKANYYNRNFNILTMEYIENIFIENGHTNIPFTLNEMNTVDIELLYRNRRELCISLALLYLKNNTINNDND